MVVVVAVVVVVRLRSAGRTVDSFRVALELRVGVAELRSGLAVLRVSVEVERTGAAELRVLVPVVEVRVVVVVITSYSIHYTKLYDADACKSNIELTIWSRGKGAG